MSQDGPARPTAYPLDVGAEISLQGRAVPPVLEGIPTPPQEPTPNPAQAHPQLPRMKFSCFVNPSVPEPGRVKRREASCRGELG